eukprot:1148231-Pelagomonas_calceolata.AAC.4
MREPPSLQNIMCQEGAGPNPCPTGVALQEIKNKGKLLTTGRICQPVRDIKIWETSSSWGTCR